MRTSLGGLSGLVGALCVAALTVFSSGCTDLGVGRKCLATGTMVKGIQISAPALECMSKICLLHGNAMTGVSDRQVCSARCATNADCQGALIGTDPGLCQTSFVCAIATDVDIADTTEHFACQTMCICKDDVDTRFKDAVNGSPCCPASCSNKNNCPAGLPKC